MHQNELKPGYEFVYTVTDYYDGPRKGIANFQGKPHLYECIFDESKDSYSDLFRLAPVDAETFQLAIEAWEIWRRWEFAFHSGETEMSTHPALPREAKRHEELKQLLDKALVIDARTAITQIGQLKYRGKVVSPKVCFDNFRSGGSNLKTLLVCYQMAGLAVFA